MTLEELLHFAEVGMEPWDGETATCSPSMVAALVKVALAAQEDWQYHPNDSSARLVSAVVSLGRLLADREIPG